MIATIIYLDSDGVIPRNHFLVVYISPLNRNNTSTKFNIITTYANLIMKPADLKAFDRNPSINIQKYKLHISQEYTNNSLNSHNPLSKKTLLPQNPPQKIGIFTPPRPTPKPSIS